MVYKQTDTYCLYINWFTNRLTYIKAVTYIYIYTDKNFRLHTLGFSVFGLST